MYTAAWVLYTILRNVCTARHSQCIQVNTYMSQKILWTCCHMMWHTR